MSRLRNDFRISLFGFSKACPAAEIVSSILVPGVPESRAAAVVDELENALPSPRH
jgi:hypothetical protein